jgi:hypothetical protein
MTTHFIEFEIDLNESPIALPQAIEAELQKRGEPLRWAVTQVEDDLANVEAIVTTGMVTSEPIESNV